MVYFDHNSTAPYSPKVIEYIQGDMVNQWGNASSEYEIGYHLSGVIKNNRHFIADFLGCSTQKLFFTAGATESINSVLSPVNLHSHRIKRVITSPMEHHATLNCCKRLEENNISISYIKNDESGNIDLNDLKALCEKYPNSVVSLCFVNNETGVISPAKEIIEIAHGFECVVHLDSVQALGKIPFSLDDLDVDFASFSGHKIGSFKGVGLLYVKSLVKFKPFIVGGEQERSFRAGTYNLPGIHSLKLAIEDIDLTKDNLVKKKRDSFETEFLKLNPSFEINGINAPRVSNTSNIHLCGHSSREIMLQLSSRGICVSTGSACSNHNVNPSHVIYSMRGKNTIADSSLRVSLGIQNSDSEMALLAKSLKKILGSGE